MGFSVQYLNNFLLFFTLIFNLVLGTYIYFYNRKNEINTAFAKVMFCISLWTLAFLVFVNVKSPIWVLFWRRATPVGSALAAGYFYYFTLIFPKPKFTISLRKKAMILLPGYVFSCLAFFTPLLIKGFIFELNKPIFGPLYYFYAFYLILFFSLALVNLLKKYLVAVGQEKLRIFYVLFGMFLSVVSGVVFSLILPLFGMSKLFALGPPFTLFIVGFVVYAIIRHRLLEIENFLFRGMAFFAGGIAIAGTAMFMFADKINYLLPFYTALTNFTLALFVLFHNPRSKINRSFTVISFSIVVWALAIFLYWQTNSPDIALWFSKAAYASTSFIPAFFVFFTLIYPKEERPITRLMMWIIFSPILLLLALNFSNLIVQGVEKVDWGYNLIPGPYYFIYTIYFLSYMGWAFWNLVKQYRKYSGSTKMQAAYIFIGFLLGSVPPVITNLILPSIGNTSLTHIGPPFTIILVGFIAYAILKHRLMSMEVIVQKGVVYTLTTALILSFYALAVIFSETYLRNVMGYSSLVVTALAALLIAIAYQPLVRFFQKLSDQIFFRGRYDYRKTLQQISQKIASVIELRELTQLIVSSFIDTMRVSEISFLLLDKEKEHFRAMGLKLERYKKIEIDVDSPIISWLCSSKDILVRDEIEEEIGRQEALGEAGEEKRRGLEEVKDEMERLGISVWVPIISKKEMIGIIALGDKLSGEIFSSEDLGLLSTLGSQTAVALDNARLYNEVVNMKDYSEEILRSMVDGVLTVDTRGRVVTYNLMAEKITGRKFAEVIGKACEEIWGKRGTVTRVIENTLHDHSSTNFDTGIASPEKGLVPVSISSTVLKDHEGKKIGALMTIIDMTEVKQLEGKVRRADKLTALATMAAGMAHEIKNPLSSMKVLSQLLPLRYEDKEYRKKLQEIMPREINRIDRIVENLLGFARATAPHFEKVDVNEFMKQTIADFSHQAQEAEVEIIKEFTDLPQIEMDKGQMSQVFSNLVLNAVQAMRTGGTLKVKTMPGKKVDQIMQNIKVQVSDTGHGISEEGVKKLFDPFYTTKYGGTGLGLTITHSIVDGHKGYIDVESKLGKGTTFTITLPVSQGLL